MNIDEYGRSVLLLILTVYWHGKKIYKVLFTRNLKLTADLNQDTGSRTGTISLYPGFIYFSTIVMLYTAWFTKTSAFSTFLSGFILQPVNHFQQKFGTCHICAIFNLYPLCTLWTFQILFAPMPTHWHFWFQPKHQMCQRKVVGTIHMNQDFKVCRCREEFLGKKARPRAYAYAGCWG